MNDYSVKKYGTDSSGRDVLMTVFMWSVLQRILADPRIAPFAHKIIVVQGAFQELLGGGAEDSAGFHNKGGCLDIRTWNLTRSELTLFIRVARELGFAFWRRDRNHGDMDEHAHGILGDDYPLAPGAAAQWHDYVKGGDGLKGNGRDYEWRPNPLVLSPPEEDMALSEDDVQRIAEAVAKKVWTETVPTADSDSPRGIKNAIKKLYDAKFPAKK